jgi:dCMP deaminase
MKDILLDFFKKTVNELSKQSKCVSHQVGCLIIKDERIISMGYNGTPSGFTNCNCHFDKDNFIREDHHTWSLQHEVHAEINALMFAVKNGISTNGATLICTLQPCSDCLKAIIQSGIKEVYYLKDYDKAKPLSVDFKNYLNENIIIQKI